MAENAVHLLTGGSQIRIWPQKSQQNQESSKSNRVPHWNSAEERQGSAALYPRKFSRAFYLTLFIFYVIIVKSHSRKALNYWRNIYA